MKAAAFITILLGVSSMAIIPDGSVATAVFRSAQPKARRADPASKKRRDDTSAFDQIIVETLEEPVTQRASATLILFLFSTGLLIGAVLLLLFILCLLRVFRAQIAYQPVKQKDDQEAPFTKAILKKPQTVPFSSEFRPLTEAANHTQSSEESATVKPRRSKKRRAKERSSKYRRRGRYTHYDEEDDDDDDDDDASTTSQLRLDLHIEQDKPRRTTRHSKRYQEVGTDSSESSEAIKLSIVGQRTDDARTKTRPLVFCMSPNGQENKSFRYGTKLRDLGSRLEKDIYPDKAQDRVTKAAKAPTLHQSPSYEVDENFFGEQTGYQARKAAAYKPGKKPKSKPREEPGTGNGLDAAQQTVTLDELKTLLDEMLAKTTDGKSPRSRTPR